MIKSSPKSPLSPSHIPWCPPRRTRPCDRCHAIKERCRWLEEEKGVQKCERCSRLGRICENNRPVGRIGRKRASPAGNRMSLRRPGTSVMTSSAKPDSGSPSLAVSLPTTVPAQSTSLQISRIHHPNESLASIPPQMVLFPELNQLEIHFLDTMLHKGIKVDKYLIGPTFREGHLQSFVDHLNAEMPHVKDAFIACASHLTDDESLLQVAQGQSIGYRRAAAAIASLRISNIYSDNDLSMMLILGVAIITFTLHHSSALPICKYILGLVNSMYEKDPLLLERLNGDTTAFLLCLLGTEVEECAISCQLPTIRIRPGSFDHLIDRFTGISAPIFIHFYDVCHLSEEFKQFRCSTHSFPDDTLEDRRNKLYKVLEEWRPTVPAIQLTKAFTPHETMTMISQANSLRLAALIILYRLRHAYGTDDDIPLAMANGILVELDTIMELTGRAVPFADLPHLVACFELKDSMARRGALEKTKDLINFSQHCRNEQLASLVAFWRVRDAEHRHSLYWTDVASCIT